MVGSQLALSSKTLLSVVVERQSIEVFIGSILSLVAQPVNTSIGDLSRSGAVGVEISKVPSGPWQVRLFDLGAAGRFSTDVATQGATSDRLLLLQSRGVLY